MPDNPVVIYGSGYLGRQLLHHLRSYYAATTVLGFADDTRPSGEQVVPGLFTLGGVSDVSRQDAASPKSTEMVFAIGYSDMLARAAALERVLGLGYRLFSIIHPGAMIEPNAQHGEGCVVLAGAVLDQGVVLGSGCFIDIGVRLGAGTLIGKNCYLSSGSSTGSRVRLGDSCFVGMDCTLTTDVQVGSNVFVNAKTLVPRNIGDNVKIVELHKSKNLPRTNGSGT